MCCYIVNNQFHIRLHTLSQNHVLFYISIPLYYVNTYHLLIKGTADLGGMFFLNFFNCSVCSTDPAVLFGNFWLRVKIKSNVWSSTEALHLKKQIKNNVNIIILFIGTSSILYISIEVWYLHVSHSLAGTESNLHQSMF